MKAPLDDFGPSPGPRHRNWSGLAVRQAPIKARVRNAGAVLTIFAIIPLFLSACSTPPQALKPGVPDQVVVERNQVESLLYDLVKSEKDVSGILVIKKVDPAVGALIKEIAGFCAAMQKQLDAFAKLDPSLRLDQIGLPPMETRTRDSIAGATSRELLFNSGRQLEVRLLLTQISALDYGFHLAKVAGERDEDPARQKVLKEWSKSFGALRERAKEWLIHPPVASK